MSSLDYTAILCKMAGIAYCEQGVEGRTPRIFGGSGRRWALTESLHPKDYYRAALVSENYRFYFCNPIPVGYDGRLRLEIIQFVLQIKKEEMFMLKMLKRNA